MNLHLTDGEVDVLRSVLEGVLGELSSEIADTDNPAYRASLSRRRDLLRGVLSRLTPVVPPQAGAQGERTG